MKGSKEEENKNYKEDNHNQIPHREYSDRVFDHRLGIHRVAGDGNVHIVLHGKVARTKKAIGSD